MRALIAASALLLVGACAGPGLLPTTLFHAPLPEGASVESSDWLDLVRARDPADADVLAAASALSADEWLVWTQGSGRGALARVRRTRLGLEAQSEGVHVGPAIRPTLRALDVRGVRVVVIESSRDEASTDRDAFLYLEHGARIEPLTIEGAPARLEVRAARSTPLEHGWSREVTFTVTLEASERGLVAHEHASVREIAPDRPQLAARSTYEVERARLFVRHGATLAPEGPSLLDDDGR